MTGRRFLENITRRTFVIASLVVAAGIVITFLLFGKAREYQTARFQTQFEKNAEVRCKFIAEKLEQCLVDATSLQRFVLATGDMDQRGFSRFVAPFLQENAELQAIEWIPRVPHRERARFERMGRQVAPNFQISERIPNGGSQPAKARDSYYPVLYVEPVKGNEKAVGFDLGSDATRRKALERARDTGEPTVTERIRLVQETEDQYGFLIFVPFYRMGMPTETTEQRSDALKGFALAVFRASTIVKAAVEDDPRRGLSFALLDLSAPEASRLLYRWEAPAEAKGSWRSVLHPTPPRYLKEFLFAGRLWGVQVTASQAYLNLNYPLTFWIILPIGFLLTASLGFYIWTILSHRTGLQRTVSEKTLELRTQQRRLADILEGTHVGTWEWNVQTGEVAFNERWAEIIGCTLAELAPLSIATWTRHAHPEDLALSNELLERHFRRELPYYVCEVRMRHKSGKWVWVMDRGRVVTWTEEGKPLLMSGTHQDITERKEGEAALRQSEAQVRLLLNSTGEAIYGIDLQGNCVFANPSCLRMLGYREMSQLLGRNMHRLVHHSYPDGRPMAEEDCQIYRAFREGEGIHADDEVLWRADGNSFPVEYWSHPQIGNGRVTGAVVTFIDITQRRRAEELQAMEERIRLARDLHDGMLQSLTAASLQLAVVKQQIEKDPQGAQQRMSEIQKYMGATQKDMRIQIQELREPLPARSLPPLPDRLRELADKIRRQWGLEVEIQVQPWEGHWSPERGQDLYFIVHEALTNAAKHAAATRARVLLALDDRRWAVLTVSDNGRGFPIQGRYDGESLASMNLGPRTLRERINALGGTLVLASSHQGATLEITIPLGSEGEAS